MTEQAVDMLERTKLIDKYERLFAEEGWKELVADLAEKQDQLAKSLIMSISDHDHVQFTRGLAAGYRYITTLEETIASIKTQQAYQDLPQL